MKSERCPPKTNVKFPPCFQKCPGVSSKKNPGNLRGLHYLANHIRPDIFDGIKLDYFHRLSANKTINALWTLSHNIPSGFRFGGTYMARLNENMLQTPTIHADINPSTLSTNIGILYYPFQCLRIEAELQKADEKEPLKTQTCIEWSTRSSTLTAALYDVHLGSGRGTLSYLQAATDRLDVGGELLLEWTDPQSVMTDIALAARYRKHNYSLAATISRQGVDVSYWHQLHRNIQMASMWAWQRKTEKSLATICYQWNFKDAYVRGMFDSTLSVGVLYSKFMHHVPIGMNFSLLMNMLTNRFVVGLNITLDPSGLRRGE